MEQIAFYLFAGLAIAAALLILFTRNLMYAAFALFITFFGVAALYVLAMADFLAVAQIMVYVGGVLVLLVFGIMLTHQPKVKSSAASNSVLAENRGMILGGVVAALIFAMLAKVIVAADFVLDGPYAAQKSTMEKIGLALMTTHLLPFEMVAVLLLAVLVGTGYLAFNRIKQTRS